MSRHVLNSNSSRSHCVFTVHLEIRNSDAAAERAVLAKLNLVDLAGSERTKKTNATGQVCGSTGGEPDLYDQICTLLITKSLFNYACVMPLAGIV
jgi:hypothetical protein